MFTRRALFTLFAAAPAVAALPRLPQRKPAIPVTDYLHPVRVRHSASSWALKLEIQLTETMLANVCYVFQIMDSARTQMRKFAHDQGYDRFVRESMHTDPLTRTVYLTRTYVTARFGQYCKLRGTPAVAQYGNGFSYRG